MPNCTQNHVATYTNSKLLLIFLVKFQNSLPLFTNFVQKTTWNQTRGMWSKSLRIWQKILCIWWRFFFLWLQEAVGLACFSHWAFLWYSCGWSPFPLRRMPQKNCRDNKIPWKRKNYLMHWWVSVTSAKLSWLQPFELYRVKHVISSCAVNICRYILKFFI